MKTFSDNWLPTIVDKTCSCESQCQAFNRNGRRNKKEKDKTLKTAPDFRRTVVDKYPRHVEKYMIMLSVSAS